MRRCLALCKGCLDLPEKSENDPALMRVWSAWAPSSHIELPVEDNVALQPNDGEPDAGRERHAFQCAGK